MNAWVSLLKKELRLGMSAFLGPIITFVILTVVAGYIGSRNGFTWEVVQGVALFATGFQIFYLVYYMLTSLQAERKNLHLWLHSPMPGYGLLLAKLVAGFISMLLTLFVTGTTLLIALNQSVLFSEHLQLIDVTSVSFFGGTHLILLALTFGIYAIFYWMIFLLINRHLGSFLSFLATIAIFTLLTTIFNAFKETSLYGLLTQWGEIQLTGITESIGFSMNLETGTEVMTEVGNLSLYLGVYLIETVIAILLFVAACWMLDRKVEV
ncbi:hypothetical protein ACFFHM_03405 [Halalkalibacter kiskunsagensis]|uniref:ABC transporter permease n=1 Tax=Halalkalibacter kiskunsagensis TaxID=1548599 RepID=A0ABV6K8G8_9BACI